MTSGCTGALRAQALSLASSEIADTKMETHSTSGVTIFRKQVAHVIGECAAKITMLALLNGAHPLRGFNFPLYMLWRMRPKKGRFQWYRNQELWKETKTLLPQGCAGGPGVMAEIMAAAGMRKSWAK
jgi:hypothetical protein